MKKRSAGAVLIWRIIGFIISTGGIVLHMYDNRIVETGFMIKHKLAYFTIQTNVWIALLFLFLIVRTLSARRRDKKWSVAHISSKLQAALTLYISMTMLGFWLVLAPMTGIPRNPFMIFSTMLLHTVTPLLAIIDYVLFAEHGHLEAKNALTWLIYPFAYLVFVLLYSRTITEPYYSFKMGGRIIELMYPYPFLDANVIGLWGVIAASAALAAVFYLLGRLFIYLDTRFQN